jgi:hypothetical protein
MPSVTYVFGDILTGEVIQEISCSGVSMSRGFGQGELRAAFSLDQSGKDNRDLLSATQEGRSYVIAERDKTPIWGGIVWSRTYQSQAKVFELYCRAFEHYPEYRFVRSDLTYTDQEQRNIFRDLWTQMMASPNSIKVDLPGSFTTAITKSLSVKAFEYKTYREAMDSVANGGPVDGFDWTIDISKVGGVYVKTLRIGYPTLGAVEPVIFDYAGQVLNYWQNGTMAKHGTNIFGLGAGEGSTMLAQEVIHADLLAGGFPRYDVDVSFKDVNSSSLLTSLSVQAADVRKAGRPIMTVEIRGTLDPEFGSYGLGDAVQIYFRDPRHPDPADRIFTSRILGWEYYPPSDNSVEFARLVFEGEDL